MPQDIVKTSGPLKSSKPDVGGGASKNIPVFGIVKDNIDPTRSGRIKVLIGDKSPQDSDNADSWVTVSYLSNFFGKIDGAAGNKDNGTYKSNPSSYGEWHAPPDIGTKVICIFVNGDPNYGFYIGCVPEPETLHMVPAIGSSDKILANEGEANSYGGATRLPVTNLNTNNKSMANSSEFNDSPRPVHSYTASIMNQQGILRDPIRGPISSSASREAASRVGWGVSTPGRPIYEGGFDDSTIAKNLEGDKAKQLKVVARRGGHSIVMDDGDIIGRDQLVRIRTALGHQILMSDDGQTLMILHSNGQSYIELGKEGTVDIFSTNSFNVRTQGDINFHADRNVNIHAKENFNVQAKNIHTNSEEKTKIRAASDVNMAATGKITGLAGGAIAWGGGGDVSLVGGGQAFVNGSKVNLNSGAPGTSPDSVGPIPLVAQTDTLFDQEKGFIASPGKLLTITSRAPAHAPWANAGQGVDIKTSMNAADNLPAPAAPATQSTNQAAQATNPKPPATATVASAPTDTPKVSQAIDKNTTAAAVASNATNAAEGPLADATKKGTAIVETAEGKVAAVGAMAMTPAQLELGGALKPGAATLVNALVQTGKTIEQALPKAVFSGVIEGAKDLTNIVENVAAQATTLVNTMQKAQSALGAMGAITGKEAPTQIAGMVNAAATVGIEPVVDVVKSTSAEATNTVKSVSNTVTGVASNATSAVNTVKNLASGATQALDSVNKLAGTVSSGLGSLSGAGSSLTGSASGALSGAVNSAVGKASAIAGQATGALNQANALAGKATGALNKAQGALKAIGAGGAAAKLTETIGGLGGIQSALSAMGSVPSLSSLVDQAEGVATSAFNAIKKSFKPLKAGVPQNLTKIAKENAAAAATVASTTGNQSLTSTLNSVAGAAGDISGKLNGALKGASGALTSVSGALNGVTGAINSATGAIGGISNTLTSVNNSLSSVSGALNKGTATLSKVAAAGTAITTTFNNVTAVASTTAKSATGSALNTTIGGVDNAINSVSAIAGAGPTIKNGLQELSNAASVVQKGAQASVSSTLASGLSNLPGGVNTVASVTNNAPGATNEIPGTQQISTAIKTATTSAMNGVATSTSALNALSSIAGEAGSIANSINGITGSVSGALGSVSGALNKVNGALNAANKVSGTLDKLSGAQGKLNSLTSLAAAGLPVGAIAELQSSIASLAGGIPNLIGLPAVGFNTSDRGSITAQIDTVIGDPGIPKPNLVGEISEESKQSIEEQVTKTKEELTKAQQELDKWIAVGTSLKINYLKQRDLAGENDITTQQARKAWQDMLNNPEFLAAEAAFLKAFDANEAARTNQLNSKIAAINNASTPEELLALTKKG